MSSDAKYNATVAVSYWFLSLKPDEISIFLDFFDKFLAQSISNLIDMRKKQASTKQADAIEKEKLKNVCLLSINFPLKYCEDDCVLNNSRVIFVSNNRRKIYMITFELTMK